DEFQELLRAAGSRLVVVEFSARWCGPCKRVGPIFQVTPSPMSAIVFLAIMVTDSNPLKWEAPNKLSSTSCLGHCGRKVTKTPTIK
ncbi:TXN, partial [Lemmus lemmus]